MKLIELVLSSSVTDDEATRILNKIKQDEKFYQSLKRHSKVAYGHVYEKLSSSADKKKFNKKTKNKYIEDRLRELMIVGRHDSRHASAFRNIPLFLTKNGFVGKVYRDYYIFLVIGLLGENENYKKMFNKVEIENVDGGIEYPTVKIFKSIISSNEEFNLILEDILLLYEVLHFKRMTPEEENEIFKQELIIKANKESHESSGDSMKEFVGLVENKVNQAVKEQSQTIKDIKSNVRDLKNQDKESEKKFKSVFQDLEALRDGLVKLASVEEVGKIRQEVKTWDDKIRSLENKIKKEISSIEKEFKNSLSSGITEIEEKISQNAIESQRIIDSKIKEIVENEKRKFFEVDFRPVWLSQIDGKRENIALEEVFISTWREYLSSRYDIYLTDEQTVTIHTFLKCMNVSVFPNEKLLSSWLEVLGVEDLTFVESANPLWTRRLDWIGLSSHLEDKSKARKFGIMRDFDTAIVGAYLAPQVAKWYGSEIQNTMHLYLVPAVNSHDKLDYSAVTHLAAVFDPEQSENAVLSRKISGHKFDLDKYMPNVKEKSFSKWIVHPDSLVFRKDLMDTPARKFGIHVPEQALINFHYLYLNLKKFLTEDSSRKTALGLSMLPFLKQCYGEDLSKTYMEYVSGYFL